MEDKEQRKFLTKEIKQNINIEFFLKVLEKNIHKLGVADFNSEKYIANGNYINYNNRNLNPFDFLTKELQIKFSDQLWGFVYAIYKKQQELNITANSNYGIIKKIKNDNFETKKYFDEMMKFNLVKLLSKYNYKLDKSKSSVNYAVIKKDNEKLVVSKKANNDGSFNYLYFNLNNDSDRGNIINFIKNRTGLTSANDIVKELKKLESIEANIENYEIGVAKSSYIREKAIEEFKNLPSVFESEKAIKYLTDSRKLDIDILKQFSDSIKHTQNYENIAIPMFVLNEDKSFLTMSGYNEKLTSFYEIDGKIIKDLNRGDKGVSILKSDISTRESIKKIFISESAIDSLSYLQLKNLQIDESLLIATNGQISENTKETLKVAINNLPNVESVELCFDSDEKGVKFSEAIKEYLDSLDLNIRVENDLPQNAKDWNDELKQKEQEQQLQVQGNYRTR